MPYRINGCGTGLYGRRDPAADGSYVTTSFLCFLFVPIIPLRSYRIILTRKEPWLPFGNFSYVVLESRRPTLREVISAYARWTLFIGVGSSLFFICLTFFVEITLPLVHSPNDFMVMLLLTFLLILMSVPVVAVIQLRNALFRRAVRTATARATVSTAAPPRG